MCTTMYSYVCINIVIGFLTITNAQDIFFGSDNEVEVGSSCTTKEGTTGKCVEFKKCSGLGEVTLLNYPLFCGFTSTRKALICCSSPSDSDTTTTESPGGATGPLTDISPPDHPPGFFCGRSATQTISFPSRRSKRSRATHSHVQVGPASTPSPPVVGGQDSQRNAWPWMALLGYRKPFRRPELTPGSLPRPFLGGHSEFIPNPGLVGVPGSRSGSVGNLRASAGLASAGFEDRKTLEEDDFSRFASFGTEWFCGGVLINDQWVLTAAHCLTLKEANVVRLGEHDYNDYFDGAAHQDFTILKTVRYPNYTYPVAYHDLALIQLSRKVRLQTFMSPVCLPWGDETKTDLIQKRVLLTGWGDTEHAGDPSSILQEVYLTMFSTAKCEESYSRLRKFRTNWPKGMGQETACAGHVNGGRDACQGDSGGPITYRKSNGKYVVNGIVSSGYGCGSKNYPGIYANLQYPPHLAWIKQVAF